MGFVDCLATNAGSTYALTFGTGNAAAATEKMRIDEAGNLGIGEDNPSAKLHVVSAGLGSTINNTTTQAIFQASTTNASNLYIQDYRTAAGNDWTFAGKRIQEKIDSTWMGYVQFNGSGNNGGISFGTGTSTTQSSVAERMRINSSGKVGIGTTNPTYELDVVGNIGLDQYLYHNNDADTSIRFTTNTIGLNAGGVKQLEITSNNVNVTDTFSYTRPGGNGQYNGEIVTFGTFAASFSAGDLICLGTSGGSPVWSLADNNSTSTLATGMLGIALGSTPASGILVRGFARSTTYSALADGGIVYIGSTAGDMTTTIPTTSGNFVRIVGYVINSVSLSYGEIYFCPDNTYVELT